MVRPRDSGDPLIDRLRQQGGEVYLYESDIGYSVLTQLLESHQIIMDGVLGTGVRFPLQKIVANCLGFVRDYLEQKVGDLYVIAVDCPSGVDCDNGKTAEEVIHAELTITMAANNSTSSSGISRHVSGQHAILNIKK